VINLASKRENEEAFWTGLTNGWFYSGINVTWFVEPPPELGYDEELSVWDTHLIGENTDIQNSYNLGFLTSAFAWTGLTGGFAFMVGADVGALGGLAVWASPISAIAVPATAAAYGISQTRQSGESSTDYHERVGYSKSSGTTETSWFWPSWLWGDFETPQY
jgi:hypothetical protein